MSGSILILNGPGLDKLGEVQTEVYGAVTLAEVKRLCEATCTEVGYECDFRQSNDTGEMLEWIVGARGAQVGIVINPAIATRSDPKAMSAYAAIMLALTHTKLPTIEVHLSNIFVQNGEPRFAYDSTVSLAFVCGFGAQSYAIAIKGMAKHLSR